LIALLAACQDREPTEPVVRGFLVLDVSPGATRDAIAARIASEIEILKSRRLVEQLVEQHRLQHELGVDAEAAVDLVQRSIRARRRGDSSGIEVGIAPPRTVDPAGAAMICNKLMQMYVQFRMQSRVAELTSRAERLASELDALDQGPAADPRRDQLTAELRELDLERVSRGSDVQLVDPCRPRQTRR
jgi:uncharacterized protein involved in exopolysaccharide biosynthesis